MAFVEVYDDGLQSGKKGPYSIDLTTTLQSSTGDIVRTAKQERTSSSARRPSGGHGFAVPVSLAGLPPGSYLLQLEAHTQHDPNLTVQRRIPIRVR